MLRTILLSILITASSLSAVDFGDYLPLESGNHWTYRDTKTGSTFSIRVGGMALIANNVYHRLTGYTTEPLWVRFTSEGLVYRDEERDADAPLTLFTSTGGGWFHAPHRTCEQEGRVSETPVGYTGPAGAFPAALQIRYRSFNCADAGVEEEIFQRSIGMLRRASNSIAGPQRYDLIAASVGKLSIQAENGGAYGLTIRRSSNPDVAFVATMSLKLDQPLRVRKPSGQDYDVVLKDESGRTIWRWSEGKVFPAGIEERVLLGRTTHEVEIPARPNGQTLAPGAYVVEAWYTSGDDRVQFSAAAPADLN